MVRDSFAYTELTHLRTQILPACRLIRAHTSVSFARTQRPGLRFRVLQQPFRFVALGQGQGLRFGFRDILCLLQFKSTSTCIDETSAACANEPRTACTNEALAMHNTYIIYIYVFIYLFIFILEYMRAPSGGVAGALRVLAIHPPAQRKRGLQKRASATSW